MSDRFRLLLKRIANLRLYDRRRLDAIALDIAADVQFQTHFQKCRQYSMTSPERMYSLHKAVEYLVRAGVPGDIVETGVWRGGSSMMSALTLESLGDRQRTLWLYDTFEGMPEPTEFDYSIEGESAQELFEEIPNWLAAPIEVVRANMLSTGISADRLKLIAGKVEDTIPSSGIPEEIALLRLDTDWYASNKHELENLYPRLVSGGILIVDDYEHWAGVKKSVDEYFAAHGIVGLLQRIDYTGRLMIKP